MSAGLEVDARTQHAGLAARVEGELVEVFHGGGGLGHHFEFLASATAAHDLTETLGCFLELVGIVGEGAEAGTEAFFNTGLTYALAEQVQLDGGVRVGLTNDSDDFTPFVGISAKF